MEQDKLQAELDRLYEELEAAQVENDRQWIHETLDSIRQVEKEIQELENV